MLLTTKSDAIARNDTLDVPYLYVTDAANLEGLSAAYRLGNSRMEIGIILKQEPVGST